MTHHEYPRKPEFKKKGRKDSPRKIDFPRKIETILRHLEYQNMMLIAILKKLGISKEEATKLYEVTKDKSRLKYNSAKK